DPLGPVVEGGGQIRLVVGQVDEHPTLLLDPVAKRGTSMLDRLSFDDRAPDAPRLARHVFEHGLGRGPPIGRSERAVVTGTARPASGVSPLWTADPRSGAPSRTSRVARRSRGPPRGQDVGGSDRCGAPPDR